MLFKYLIERFESKKFWFLSRTADQFWAIKICRLLNHFKIYLTNHFVNKTGPQFRKEAYNFKVKFTEVKSNWPQVLFIVAAESINGRMCLQLQFMAVQKNRLMDRWLKKLLNELLVGIWNWLQRLLSILPWNSSNICHRRFGLRVEGLVIGSIKLRPKSTIPNSLCFLTSIPKISWQHKSLNLYFCTY